MSQSINIIKIIEENPSTKLSKPYQGRLINKLKQRLFIHTRDFLFYFSLKLG